MKVWVCAVPSLIRNDWVHESAVIVIDALRMTSVAATAMANGCTGLMAVETVEEARALAAREHALLGGERRAVRIEGFDFDNSPLAYVRERVAGKRIVMTTSNGTRAIVAAKSARRLVLGAFVNAMAVAKAVREEAEIGIVCAGTGGIFSLEDALAAGAILSRLEVLVGEMDLDDMGIACLTLYHAASAGLPAALKHTKHYRWLMQQEMGEDIDYCLSEDIVEAVPEQKEDGWFA